MFRFDQVFHSSGLGAKFRNFFDTLSIAGMLTREVGTTSGYLSGDPARLHYGLSPETILHELEITWPDGQRSILDSPERNMLLTVTRVP